MTNPDKMGSVKGASKGRDVLRYLDHHRLDHSPDHYAFAFRFLFGDDPAFEESVREISDGGVRITAAQIAKLSPSFPQLADNDVLPQLDQVTTRVLDIIRDTMDATGGLNRDLVNASVSLLAAEVSNIGAVVGELIVRTEAAERTLSDAAQQAQRLRQELHALRNVANKDQLTGLLIRAAIEDQLETLSDCCIAIVDVDYFEEITDRHGPGVGDRVLKAIAAEVVATCSPHIVGRWGPREFVVLFDRVPLQAAHAQMNRARDAIANKRLRLRENDQPLGSITISAGVAVRRGRAIAEMVVAAEALRDVAKERGRNQVVVEQAVVGIAP